MQSTVIQNGMLITRQDSGDKAGKRLLPLILTLAFLCIGIVGLIILYNVVKGYLSERSTGRQGAPLFVPSFVCSPQRWRNRYHSSWQSCSHTSRHNNQFSYKATNVFPFQHDTENSDDDITNSSSWVGRTWARLKRLFRHRQGHIHQAVKGDELSFEDEFCTEMSLVIDTPYCDKSDVA